MDIETAWKIRTGEIIPTDLEYSLGELLQVALNGCLLDDGNIVCLDCGRPNECCECGRELEED